MPPATHRVLRSFKLIQEYARLFRQQIFVLLTLNLISWQILETVFLARVADLI